MSFQLQELDSLKNLTDQIRNILSSNDTGFLFCGSQDGGFFNGNSTLDDEADGDDLWNRTQGVMIKGMRNNGVKGMRNAFMGQAFDAEEEDFNNGTWEGDNGHIVDGECFATMSYSLNSVQ